MVFNFFFMVVRKILVTRLCTSNTNERKSVNYFNKKKYIQCGMEK